MTAARRLVFGGALAITIVRFVFRAPSPDDPDSLRHGVTDLASIFLAPRHHAACAGEREGMLRSRGNRCHS